MRDQEQFLHVLDRDEAERRFRAAIDLTPRGVETVPLDAALGRVLAADVVSPVDVPSFDRSNVDGFAVVAEDTFGASEEAPRIVQLGEEVIHTGVVPKTVIRPGTAVSIATGGMVPRGADAVVMIEHAEIQRPRAADRESGHGGKRRDVCRHRYHRRRDRAATWSAADQPRYRRAGGDRGRGRRRLAKADRRHPLHRRRDHRSRRADAAREGLRLERPGARRCGARAGRRAEAAGDHPRRHGGPAGNGFSTRSSLPTSCCSRAARARERAICRIAWWPNCAIPGSWLTASRSSLASRSALRRLGGRPVVVLPGFPTSAIFTFHEFVAPVLRLLAGRGLQERTVVPARLAVKVNSEIGRTEYLLVGSGRDGGRRRPERRSPRIRWDKDPAASRRSAVPTVSRRSAGTRRLSRRAPCVDVQLLGRDLQLADLVVIGSHCIGLDYLLGELQQRGVRSKFLAVGSTAGLDAAKRGECDLAGIHLLDPKTDQYNRPFLTPALDLVAGYGRAQGVVFRRGDARFEGRAAREAIADARQDPDVRDGQPQPGQRHASADRSPARGRQAGWLCRSTPKSQRRGRRRLARTRGLGSDAGHDRRQRGLGFLPVQEERYDFVVPKSRANRPGVVAFKKLLLEPSTREALARLGMKGLDRCDVQLQRHAEIAENSARRLRLCGLGGY